MAYNGNITINTRVAKEISEIAHLPFCSQPRLPNKDELDRFLSFLGLYALADELLYDETVPEKYLNEFLSASKEIEIHKKVRPLRAVVGEEFFQMTSESLQMATKNILQAMANVPPVWRKPDEEDINRFFICVKAMDNAGTSNNRLDIAMTEFNKGTHGGKLLVGLADDHNMPLLSRLASLEDRDSSNMADIMSAIITNYRNFLLLRWSGLDDAIFATDPNFVQRVSEYKLWALESLTQALRVELSAGLPSSNIGTCCFPLMGLAIIMEAPETARPQDLFYHASNLSSALRIPYIQKEIINLQVSCASEDKIREVADKLAWEVYKRGGPEFSKSKAPIKQATYEILPTLAIGIASGGLPLFGGADIKQAILGLIGGSVTAALFTVCSKITDQRSIVGAMSNLVAYDKLSIEIVWRKIKKIWRAKD